MKKRILSIMLTVFMLVAVGVGGVQAYKIGDVIGETLYTDIVASINNYNISSHNYNGYTMIVAEDLRYYGFTVEWNPSNRTLSIDRDPYVKNVASNYVTPAISKSLLGKKSHDVLYTDIRTYIKGREVPSYNLGGITVINFEDLYPFGNVKYDDSVRRLDLTINDGLSFNSKTNTSYNQTTTTTNSTQKNNSGGYRVETVLEIDSIQCTSGKRYYVDTIQLHDYLYVLSYYEQKVYRINLLTGKKEVYADLKNIEVNYDGDKYIFNDLEYEKSALMYNPRKQCFIVTDVTLVTEDEFTGKYNTKYDCMIDVTNKVLFELPSTRVESDKWEYAVLYNTNGDLIDALSQARFPYPQYNTVKSPDYFMIYLDTNPIYTTNGAYTIDYESHTYTKDTTIISLDNINKATGALDIKFIFTSPSQGASVGMIDDETFLMMNDVALFKVDAEGNIKEKVSLETINESDGKTLVTEIHSALWVSSAGDVVFYDRNEQCFRRITNN